MNELSITLTDFEERTQNNQIIIVNMNYRDHNNQKMKM